MSKSSNDLYYKSTSQYGSSPASSAITIPLCNLQRSIEVAGGRSLGLGLQDLDLVTMPKDMEQRYMEDGPIGRASACFFFGKVSSFNGVLATVIYVLVFKFAPCGMRFNFIQDKWQLCFLYMYWEPPCCVCR